MSDRLISSYLVPVVICFGAALQKNFQSVHILLNNIKIVSQFTIIGWICVVLNFFLLLFQIIMQDYTVSPYNLPPSTYAVYQFLSGMCYHLKETLTYKGFLGACVFGILLKLVNIVVGVILNVGIINGTYATQLASPWPQSIITIVAAFFEAAIMIPASCVFIYSIATKLNIPGWALVNELAMKYAACDYIIMAGFKIYACIGYILVIKNNFVANNIYLSGNGIGLSSAIFATYIFVHGSFNAPQQMLQDYSVSSK
ncbi:hypothetical protein HDV01_006048 [Terramyces sp. JEL0728]|nr:hypothetical protein HDV01_006048 [Terramyces sp. JEL0728]